MDLEGSTSRRNKKVFYNLLEIYPHDLQFFADPPHLDLPIDEFEKLAMERMHVLRIIQQASSVKGHQLLSNGWVNCISEALKEFRLNDYNLIIMNCGSAQSEASCAYGFFCKGIGLSYEDCVKYWRDEFTKAMEHREFQKKYGYTIKHNYGKVGGKINYIPFNCTKIISANVGIGQQHGCPFKVWDNGYLKQKLTEYGFGPQVVTEIVNHAKEGNYQMACSAYFEYMHGRPSKEVINHPNQYFEESFNYEHEYQSPYCSDEDE
ncbi:DNA primase large subunit-like isoform X2 [Agrilus planipennis]|uniref:DNA primase large subunit-like isoform X2 n=1 Tax=Agrilus planipennis TaxID=224129 RepID=A0A1W4WZ23_AGRPL|nr:DNA primase large subunit-like isoform X2 [Agrilus planipennis]